MTAKPQSLSPLVGMPEPAPEEVEPEAARTGPVAGEGKRRTSLSRPSSVMLAPLKGNVYDLEKTRAFNFRRHIAEVTKTQLKVANDTSLGAPGVEAFCAILKRRFGSVAAAWRTALDRDLKSRLSFSEFVSVARDVGYTNNLKLLWNQLDVDQSGFISLNELDPEAAESIDSFRDFLINKFGNTLNAWRHIDIDKNDRLDIHELEQRCKELGYPGNARKLFFHLKCDVSKNFLSLSDLDPQAFIARMRGDHDMLLAKAQPSLVQVRSSDGPGAVSPAGCNRRMSWSAGSQSMTSLPSSKGSGTRRGSVGAIMQRASTADLSTTAGSRSISRRASTDSASYTDTRSSKWLTRQSTMQIQEQLERRASWVNADKGAKSVEDLKKMLLSRFGGYFAAWRQALDFDGNERLSFGEFCLALRELGYVGNAKAAWYALDTDKDGFIELKDIDEQTAIEVTTYRKLAREKYGNMLGAWLYGLGKDGHSGVDEKEFEKHCEEIGYTHNVSSLFHDLKNDSSRKLLTLRDYDVCASNAYTRGDLGMISEPSGSLEQKRPHELDFEERNEASFRIRWNKMQSKMQRDSVRNLHEQEREACMAPSDFPGFKKLLIRKYGTITAAWRHALDPDGNGKLSFGEFCESLRKLGYQGNKKELWNSLDSAKTGLITLDQIDAKAHAALTSFRAFMAEKFGSWLKLWNALDTNRNARVDEGEFIEEMAKLGFEGDTKYLFKLLLDKPGVTFISMADLDPSAASEHYRGPNVDRRSELEKMSVRERERLKGAQSLQQLKKCLTAKYGTITAAWKHALDLDGNGRLSFNEFCIALRDVGYVGNIRHIFNELDADGSGFISMDELDAPAAEAQASFRDLVISKYGNFLDAWEAFDRDKNGCLDKEEFVERVKELGYTGNPKMLFKLYLDKPGAKTLQLEDLDVEAARERHRNRDRNNAKAHRESVAKRLEEVKKNDVGVSTVKGLTTVLCNKYGTITAAWKHHLDPGRNGRISFVEFCNSMRDIGFKGNLKKLWAELDADNSGFITLDELDPVANRAMTEFRELIKEKHGSFIKAWKIFDANGTNSVDIDEFVSGCADMGYTGNAKKLFRYLLDKPGLTYLTLHDVDPESGQEAYRDPNRHDAKFRRQQMEDKWKADKEKIKGATDLISLKKMLVKKYGTLTQAWKHALDLDGSGKLSYGEMCKALRDLGFAGNVKELWAELDADSSGMISLDEFDPKSHRVVSEFKLFAQTHFEGPGDAWKEAAWKSMDSRNKLVVTEEEFLAWCTEVGFTPDPSLFKYLVDKAGEKVIKNDVFASAHFAD